MPCLAVLSLGCQPTNIADSLKPLAGWPSKLHVDDLYGQPGFAEMNSREKQSMSQARKQGKEAVGSLRSRNVRNDYNDANVRSCFRDSNCKMDMSGGHPLHLDDIPGL